MKFQTLILIVLTASLGLTVLASAQVAALSAPDDALIDLLAQAKYQDSHGHFVTDLDDADVRKLQSLMQEASGRNDVTLEMAQAEAGRSARHARRAGDGWKNKIGFRVWDHAGLGEVGVYSETVGAEQLRKENPGSSFRYSSQNASTGTAGMSTDGHLTDSSGRIVKFVQFKVFQNPMTSYRGALGDFVTFAESRRSGAQARLECRIPNDQFDELVRRGKISADGRLTTAGLADLDLEAEKLALKQGSNGARARAYLANDSSQAKMEARFAKIGQTYEQLSDGQIAMKRQWQQMQKTMRAPLAGKPAQSQARLTAPVGTGTTIVTTSAAAGLGVFQMVQGYSVLTAHQGESETADAMGRRQLYGATLVAGGGALMAMPLSEFAATSPALGKVARAAGWVALPLLAASEAVVYYQYSSGDMSWHHYRAHLFESGGALVGGIAGAQIGAAIGATIGSVVPVVGTTAGAIVGGVGGGIAGAFLGGHLSREVAIAIYGNEDSSLSIDEAIAIYAAD